MNRAGLAGLSVLKLQHSMGTHGESSHPSFVQNENHLELRALHRVLFTFFSSHRATISYRFARVRFFLLLLLLLFFFISFYLIPV